MLYITSLCSPREKIVDAVCELAQLGFKNIELTGGTKFYDGIEQDLFKLKEEYRLNYLVHNFFPPQPEDFVLNLASRDPDSLQRTLSLIKQAIGLSSKFGQDFYGLHPGFKNELIPEMEDRFFIKKDERINDREGFYRVMDIVLDEVVPNGFNIAVENLSPKNSVERYSFVCDSEDIEQFLGYYKNRPNVGIVLDLGHLNVASNYLRFDKNEALSMLFNKYYSRIFEIHISENGGQVDSHDISSINSWQIEFLFRNKKVLKHIPIVLEWHNLSSWLAYERFQMIEDELYC